MKKFRVYQKFFLLFGIMSSFLLADAAEAATTITRTRVNRRVEPVGVDTEHLVFSWNLLDDTRNTLQKSYRIRVVDSQDALMWDTGPVESSKMIEIEYAGKPLAPSTRYFWTVEIVNNRDEQTTLEKPANFVTGLADWQANWISIDRENSDPLPIFRKSFDADAKKIDYAIAHICGLGHYELRLNGEKIGQSFIDPGWTNYCKTCLYSSYDVTSQLRAGENVFGVLLGNGMYNVPGGRYVKFTGSFGLPKLICQLEIAYNDGTREIIASDETWRGALGPIVFSCVYGGEDFDANRIEAGWDKPGFDDAKWHAAKIVESPGGVLRTQEAPPITVAETLKPEKVSRMDNGQYIADFGYNFSGRPRILLRGKPGSKVTVKTGELIDRIWEGHSYTCTLAGTGKNYPTETSGDMPNDETVELLLPKFTYFGFQFLRIEGAVLDSDRTEADSELPTLVAVLADFTTSSAERVGTFHCSNTLVNEIDMMIERSVHSNLQSVLTDCPHREKLGWLEVAHLMGPSIMSRFDVHNLYRKICRDTTESQLENGLVPDIAPEYTRFSHGFFESPEWGSASVLLPSQLFHVYGDKQIVHQQMETMERYVDYLASTRNEQGLVKAGLGDWYDWSPEHGHAGYSQHTPGELTATVMLFMNAEILSMYATDNDEYEKYYNLACDVAKDYIKAYVKADGTVSTGSQSAQALTLYIFDVLDTEIASNDLFETLKTDIISKMQNRLLESLAKTGNRPTTGEVVFPYLLSVLNAMGRDDLIWEIVTSTEKPGYGYMLKQYGMKTLSERWDGPGESMNHCMFGHAQDWFMQNIVGIGFRGSSIAPHPIGDITSAEGTWIGPSGKVVCSWKIVDETFLCHVEIPHGNGGIVILTLPIEDENTVIKLDGQNIYNFESIWLTGISSRGRSFVIPSGTYDFEVPYHVTQEK